MKNSRTHKSIKLIGFAVLCMAVPAVLMAILAPGLVERGITRAVDLVTKRTEGPVRIATATAQGAYYQFGRQLQSALNGTVHIEVLKTEGSLDNVERLQRGEAEIALIQGGLNADLTGLSAIANLKRQYTHVIVRNDSAIRRIRDLVGKRVLLGPKKSGAYALGIQIFDFLNLKPAPEILVGSMETIEDDFASGRIDAVLTVFSLHAPLVEDLLAGGDFRLVPFDAPETIAQWIPGAAASRIPPGTYGPNRMIPSIHTSGVSTISVGTVLIARDDVSATNVRTLLHMLYKVDFRKQARLSDLDEAMGSRILDLPLHPAAEAFYTRNAPITSDSFEIASFFLAGLVCLVSATHYLAGRRERTRLARKRENILPYFESMIEYGTKLGRTDDVSELIACVDRMMSTEREAERSWLAGKIDTKHMENLYSVFGIRSRNAFNKIFKVLLLRIHDQQLEMHKMLTQRNEPSAPAISHSPPSDKPVPDGSGKVRGDDIRI